MERGPGRAYRLGEKGGWGWGDAWGAAGGRRGEGRGERTPDERPKKLGGTR